MLLRRYLLLLLIPLDLVIVGTLGYYFLEPQYSLFDSLYMTITTLTTVGYGEVHPLHTAGRIVTIFLLVCGVFTVFYAAGEFLKAIVSGEIRDLFGRQRMARSLAEMKNHLIVCGLGRVGQLVCREFSRQKLPFVLIDREAGVIKDFDLPHGVALLGDATSDEVLRQAGVERARALVTVAASDADNLYITMSARLLNERLFIVARAEGEQAEQKLLRGGANKVVAPYAIGGLKVAQAVLRPNVVDFIELATRTEHLELQIEEAHVQAGSSLVGTSLSGNRLRQELGLIIVAIKRPGQKMLYTPSGETVLEAGDTLIALGRRPDLDQLEVLARAG